VWLIVKLLDKVIINTDGASRNNPGKAGIGITIRDEDDNIIQEVAEYIGEATNNQAEYLAVIRAL